MPEVEHVTHREHRFLTQDPTWLLSELLKHGKPIVYRNDTTRVDTDYYDTEHGWRTKETPYKVRHRRYDGEDGYLEIKFHKEGETEKWRVKSPEPEKILKGEVQWDILRKLVPEGRFEKVLGVSYQRTAFDFKGIRVTVDEDVTYNGIVTMPKAILEVKDVGKVPQWLKEICESCERTYLSKSRRGLLMLPKERVPIGIPVKFVYVNSPGAQS